MAYTTQGRVGKIRVRGTRLTADLAESMLAGSSISLSTSGPMTLTMVFSDPDLNLLAAGLFARGTAVDYADLRMVVRAVDLGAGESGPTVTVTCRSAGWIRLQSQIGAKVWKKTSVAQVARLCAKKAGLGALVQSSARVRTVTRKKKRTRVGVKTIREKRESSVSMLSTYAGDMGRLLFERPGVLVFATPRWLATHTVIRTIVYSRSTQAMVGFGGPRSLPSLHRAEDSPRGVAELSAEFDGPDADEWRPGDVVRLQGVPTFSGTYLVHEVTIPLSDADPVTVSATVPHGLKTADGDTPPAVEPAAGGRGGAAGNSAPPVADFIGPLQRMRVVPGSARDDDPFTGAELVTWAAAKAGLSFGGSARQMEARCRKRKTIRPVATAVKTPGALLWRDGQVAVVVGPRTALVPRGRGYAKVKVTADGWRSAALLPGVKYPKGS